MDSPRLARIRRDGSAALFVCLMATAGRAAPPGPPGLPAIAPGPGMPRTESSGRSPAPNGTTSILGPNVQPIDLGSALRLAGVQNPDLLLIRQRVLEAVAQRQFAAVQILPTLNGGTSYDTHTGNLQQSSGNILSTNRSSVYVGAGAFAVAAGTVAIPGVFLAGNVGEGIYLYLTARQVVRQREFASAAAMNQTLLQVTLAYSELLRAEGQRAINEQTRDQAAEVSRITTAYAQTGEGRQADADRAATELARRRADLRRSEGDILRASARLCRLLNLDPSIRLTPTDAYAVPMSIVPDPVPLCELIAIALMRRPELGERRAVVREALLSLEGSRVLPFSPTVLLGFSSGGFGGGSNLVRPIFGNFGSRADFDAIAYWSLRNLGLGNLALINIAKARLTATQFQELAVMDQIRDEVAEAYARTHARFAQIGENEQAVRTSMQGFRLDVDRIMQAVPGQGTNPRPIEVLDSLKLQVEAKTAYLNAIIDYNQAHFELYVALGQPPDAALAHPVPPGGIPPAAGAPTAPARNAAAAGPAPVPTSPPPPPPPPPPPLPPPPVEGGPPFAPRAAIAPAH